MLNRQHTAERLGLLRNWKSTFFRPVAGWNLSFEDFKGSILALVHVTPLKERSSRNDEGIKHSEDEGENVVELFPVCSSQAMAVASEWQLWWD